MASGMTKPEWQRASSTISSPFRISSSNEARGEFAQKALHFPWVLEPVARGDRSRLLTHDDTHAALLKRAEGVFVSDIVADVKRKHFRLFQAQRFQQPDHGSALVPVDVRLELIDLLAGGNAQLAVTCPRFVHSSLDLRHAPLICLAIMRGDGKTLPLQQCARCACELFAKLLFRSIENWKKLRGHLFPQPARPGDIKTVTTGVNDLVDAHAPANVIQVAAAEDCDRHVSRQRPHRLPR